METVVIGDLKAAHLDSVGCGGGEEEEEVVVAVLNLDVGGQLGAASDEEEGEEVVAALDLDGGGRQRMLTGPVDVDGASGVAGIHGQRWRLSTGRKR